MPCQARILDGGAASWVILTRIQDEVQQCLRIGYPGATAIVFGGSISFGVWEPKSTDVDVCCLHEEEWRRNLPQPLTAKDAIVALHNVIAKQYEIISGSSLQSVLHARVPVLRHKVVNSSLPLATITNQNTKPRQAISTTTTY